MWKGLKEYSTLDITKIAACNKRQGDPYGLLRFRSEEDKQSFQENFDRLKSEGSVKIHGKWPCRLKDSTEKSIGPGRKGFGAFIDKIEQILMIDAAGLEIGADGQSAWSVKEQRDPIQSIEELESNTQQYHGLDYTVGVNRKRLIAKKLLLEIVADSRLRTMEFDH
jgi:hypothetical protein